MNRLLREDGLPPLELEANERWFSVAFRRRAERAGREAAELRSQKSSQKILEALRSDPDLTIDKLAEMVGISDRAIKKHLAKLQATGRLRRIGPDKGGHWEVLD